MRSRAKQTAVRRVPVQGRAQLTVEAILDAAIKLLKRGGVASITTNRIAETSGVSIGSVYQYFPDKRAIFVALHERHIRQVDEVMHRQIHANADATLEQLLSSLIDGMIEAHTLDPELFELLQIEVPHRAAGKDEFSVRLHGAFRSALARHAREFRTGVDLDTRAFFVSNMVEALGHAVMLRRPRGLSLSRAKAELQRTLVGYLRG